MDKSLYDNFKEIVTKEITLIDVRAPIEFSKGAFKSSTNIPIMDDEERRLVGIKYKNAGNEKAIELGLELVSGEIKENRLNAWLKMIKENPNSLIYCFRGGQRSQFTQQWIYENFGIEIPRIKGGYKAFRNFLIESLLSENLKVAPIIVGGHTGSGKTNLLKKFDNFVDLEGIANHRGSTFGGHVTPQPTQINFENNLAYDVIQKQEKGYKYIFLEDEGKHIGKSFIPQEFFDFMGSAELVILEASLERRTEITLDEYVTAAQGEYIEIYGETEEAYNEWHRYIKDSMMRVSKKLGNEKAQELISVFEFAFEKQMKTGDVSYHKDWISSFLRDYFDKMYGYQIEKNSKKIIFRGTEQEVSEFLKEKVDGLASI